MNTTIKEIPLLFQTDMVQAVMEDRKNQTRRTKGLEGLDNYYFQSLVHHVTGHFTFVESGNYSPKNEDVKVAKSPYGKPGDLIWVREAWNKYNDEDGEYIAYKADDHCSDFKWKPSIHMPKAACRIWLMVEEIRVERVQDAADDDIISEGVRIPVSNNAVVFTLGEQNKAIDFLPNGFAAEGAPKLTHHQYLFAHWAELWCKVNGRESWDANPWVWAVKFRVLSKTGRPSDEVIQSAYESITNK